MKDRVAALQLPEGVYVSYAGQAEAERDGQIRLGILTALSIALVVIVLTMAFTRRALAVVLLSMCRSASSAASRRSSQAASA